MLLPSETSLGTHPAARAPSRRFARAPSGLDDSLARYFHEVACQPVMPPNDEFRAGRQMQALDLELWLELLCYPPLFRQVVTAAARALADTLGVHRGAELVGSLAKGRRRGLRRLARRLRDLDQDRQLLRAVMEALDAAAAAPARQRSQAFRAYHEKVRSLHAASQALRDQFVRSNLRLVVSVACRFRRSGVPLSDLIQEGNIGLIKAMGRYDHRRGYRFSTYACWWIRHTIGRALADKEHDVRIPVYQLATLRTIDQKTSTLTQTLGRPPTTDELGVVAGVGSEAVDRARAFAQAARSLEGTLSEVDQRQLHDVLPDPRSLEPVEAIINRSVLSIVGQKLLTLQPIERDVLSKRFGLAGEPEQTLEQLGDKYQLSRERIRQIQEQALTKLRRRLQASKAV